jgi:hypothetical protein
VVQSTPAYAARRVKAAATVPGTSAHQALLNEVAEEMTDALLKLAAKSAKRRGEGSVEASKIEIAHVAAHRWGAAFPDDWRCGGGGGVGGGVPRRRGEESGGVRGFLCVPQDRRRSAQRGGRRSAGRGNDRRNARGVAVTPKLHVIDTRVRVVIISQVNYP